MLNIAVDGYSSAGKGEVCSKLAEKLGIVHFDTGAIYRLIGVYVKDNNIDPYDEEAVSNVIKNINVHLEHSNGKQITYLNGKNISDRIRESEISDICSITSTYPKCREFVLKIQREMAQNYDLIMEGRDITSHVLPNADFKFFLTADIEERARRRHKDFLQKGENISLEKVRQDLIERDRRDITRDTCPLILTEGTIYIDNTNMTIEEEVDLMYKIIKGEIT